VDQLEQPQGVWGLLAKTSGGNVGTALDIRLPKKIIDFLKLKKGEVIAIFENV
jgi:hypothetical protein